jgi:hypothetical protein
MLLLLADHRTGSWKGSGGSLAAALGICEREGRYLLKSLAAKEYIRLPDKIPPRGGYLVQICKYFNTRRHQSAVIGVSAAQACRLRRHGRAALQEVKTQEEKIQEPAQFISYLHRKRVESKTPLYDALNEQPTSEATLRRIGQRYAERERRAKGM